MDKTYAETKGHAPFDWNKALDEALFQEPDDATHHALSARAKAWTTCACGNACAIIPRYQSGSPKDDMLGDLGRHFFIRVFYRRWDDAKATLRRIEERSQALITEELAKLNLRSQTE